MNNLPLYYGLTDSRMSASDTDLPVQNTLHRKLKEKNKHKANEKNLYFLFVFENTILENTF